MKRGEEGERGEENLECKWRAVTIFLFFFAFAAVVLFCWGGREMGCLPDQRKEPKVSKAADGGRETGRALQPKPSTLNPKP